MTDQIAARIAKVTEIIHHTHMPMPAPDRTDGDWIVWSQFASKGLHARYVDELKAAGVPAFFNATERKFGVKK